MGRKGKVNKDTCASWSLNLKSDLLVGDILLAHLLGYGV